VLQDNFKRELIPPVKENVDSLLDKAKKQFSENYAFRPNLFGNEAPIYFKNPDAEGNFDWFQSIRTSSYNTNMYRWDSFGRWESLFLVLTEIVYKITNM
jgi:hypothetical protein